MATPSDKFKFRTPAGRQSLYGVSCSAGASLRGCIAASAWVALPEGEVSCPKTVCGQMRTLS